MMPVACDISTMRLDEPDWSAGSIAVTDLPEPSERTWRLQCLDKAATIPEIPAYGLKWIAIARSRLKEAARLPDNWDDRGSPGSDPAIAEAADLLLCRLEDIAPTNVPPPSVCPIPGGTLQFEWTSGHRHLEVEFIDERRLAVLQEDAGSQAELMESYEVPLTRVDEVRKLLRWLVSA